MGSKRNGLSRFLQACLAEGLFHNGAGFPLTGVLWRCPQVFADRLPLLAAMASRWLPSGFQGGQGRPPAPNVRSIHLTPRALPSLRTPEAPGGAGTHSRCLGWAGGVPSSPDLLGAKPRSLHHPWRGGKPTSKRAGGRLFHSIVPVPSHHIKLHSLIHPTPTRQLRVRAPPETTYLRTRTSLPTKTTASAPQERQLTLLLPKIRTRIPWTCSGYSFAPFA